jgi:hypothetical protein
MLSSPLNLEDEIMNNKIPNLSRRQVLLGSSLLASSFSIPGIALEKSGIKALINAKANSLEVAPLSINLYHFYTA